MGPVESARDVWHRLWWIVRPPSRLLLPPLLYLGVAWALFHQVWSMPAHATIGVGGDSRQMIWLLGWPLHALAHGLDPWLTSTIDYPRGVNLTWTPTPLVPALLAAPITIAWGPVVTYNVLATISPVLSAWAAYAAIGRLVRSRAGALLGGLLYGFSPFVTAHALGHLNLVMAWTPPLALLLLHELLVRRRWPAALVGVLLGLLGAAQFYTTAEVALTTALMAAIGVVLLVVVALWKRAPIAPAARRLGIAAIPAAIIGIGLGAPTLLVMRYGPEAVHTGIQPANYYVTDLASVVLPDGLFAIAPSWAVALTGTFTGYPLEWNGYVGVALLALMVATVWVWRRRALVAWSGAMALVVLVLSFGTRLHVFGVTQPVPIPWRALVVIPLFEHVLPSRLMIHFYLFAGIVLAFVVRRILDGRPWLPFRATSSVAVAASLVLLVPSFPIGATPAETPPFFFGAAARIPEGSVALVAPYADSDEILPMVWQANAGYRYRMPEGYAIRPGPGDAATFDPDPTFTGGALSTIEAGGTAPPLDGATRRSISCDVARWNVRTVIVGPMPHQEQAAATLAWALGREPEHVQGVLVWWNVRATC